MSKQRGILRPLGLALVLAIGFGAVFGLAGGWGVSIWEGLHPNRVSESLEVRADGTPLIQRYEFDEYQNRTYRTLDGTKVPDVKEDEIWLACASLSVPSRGWRMFPLDSFYRVARFSDEQTQPNFWYFIADGKRDGRGYFVGYDSHSKLCMGYIGREGFRPDPPPAEQWFPIDGVKLEGDAVFSRRNFRWYAGYYGYNGTSSKDFPAWKVDMISGDELLQVDLRKRSVAALKKADDLLSVGILDTASVSKSAGEDAPRVHLHEKLAVRTADRVLLFDPTGKPHAAFVIPEEYRDGSIRFNELDAGKALLEAASRPLPDHRRSEELAWIDTSGKVLRRTEVSLAGDNGPSEKTMTWIAALIVPAPIILAFLATAAVPINHLTSGAASSYSTALAQCLALFWPALLVVSLLAAVLAWYCYCRHRRYYQPLGGVWLVFVLLTGVPGFVAYLFHRRWPVLEKCPTCGHEVPRDREACAKCGAAFPVPEPKGCEVFA